MAGGAAAEALAGEALPQAGVGFLELLVAEGLGELEHVLLDGAVGEHDEQQRGAPAEAGEQRAAHGEHLMGGRDDHCRRVGEPRQ